MNLSNSIRLKLLSQAFVIALLISPTVSADNWPSWRGPDGTGVAKGSAPTEWSETKNVLWKVDLPGPAGATPCVWGDQIFLTSAKGKDLVLIAISKSGEKQWEKLVATGDKPVRRDEGNMASPSPVTDGKHVWTFMANGILVCYTVKGEEVWRMDVPKKYGKFEIQFGLSSTPVLHGNNLYLQLIHGKWSPSPSKGIVVALNKANGKEVWKHARDTDATEECKHSYASPILYKDGKQEYLVTHGADYAIGHSLKDGKELWRLGGLNPRGKGIRYHNTLRFVASPAMGDGIIVVPTAKRSKVVAIKGTSKGDITNTANVLWMHPRLTPDVPTPLVHNGIVYLCSEGGMLSAVDAKSGELYYTKKRTTSDRHRASPVLAGDKLYLTARNGTVSVCQTGKEFKILSQNTFGETMSASPVVVDGVIYLRTWDRLWAVGSK